MRLFFGSFYRVISRAGFLAVALLMGLVFWYLPSLLNLDAYRPRVITILESTFQCKALVGEVTGQLVPSPGLVIAHVVLLENSKTPRVLASVNAVRMALLLKPLLKGTFEIHTIRFLRPRFIAHRIPQPSGLSRWVMLTLPKAPTSQENIGIDDWEVRNGSVEIWDQARTPTLKWVADQFSGSFHVASQIGEIEGKAATLGRRAMIGVHYNGAAAYPIQAHLNDIQLSALQFLLPTRLMTLEGESDILLRTRFQPSTDIRAQFDQPSAAGKVEISVQRGARGNWRWSALGQHARLKGTSFELPEWSAKGDEAGAAVYARGVTAEGGLMEIGWTKLPDSSIAALDVDLSSVTIRQILQIFNVESKTPAAAGASFNPHGYEAWRISAGSMRALIHGATSFEVRESGIDASGMHLELTGSFDLGNANPQARLQGDLQAIPMASVVERFFPAPAPVTGLGAAQFTLSFPLSANWVKGLNGPLQIDVKDGILKALKTIYRITAVLNLGNYLRLRFPQVTAQGIEFEDLYGHLVFQNGALSTDDLFLKSPNMNVGAKGTLDIPGKQMTVTLRLEMFRFLEDVLRDVPLTHWIFKKPNKIFLPLVVSLEGPWDDVSVR